MNGNWTTVVPTALLLATGFLASTPGFSQAAYTATQNVPALSVYGGYSSVDSDYGTKNQTGYFAGIGYSRAFSHIYVLPSLEIRGSISPLGENVAENTFQAGFKVEHAYFHRYHPYAEVLFGTGTIKYRPGLMGPTEKSDNSVVPSYGGGIDVDVYKNFAVKADYFQSHWNTGGQVTYSPSAFNVGVVYRISFGH